MSKTRSRQRDAGKERHWREVIRAQGSSGQSVREYCRQAGVKEAAFYWWRRELAGRSPTENMGRRGPTDKAAGPRSRGVSLGEAGRGSAGAGRGRPAASRRRRKPGPGRSAGRAVASGRASPFLPIHVLSDGTAAGVEIHLGGGPTICVRPGFDRQTLLEVLAALEGRSC